MTAIANRRTGLKWQIDSVALGPLNMTTGECKVWYVGVTELVESRRPMQSV